MSLSEQVYNGLKTSLLSGTLNARGLILENAIAQEYHVSKTPAREALNRLVDEGILIKYPRKGYIVKKMSDHQFACLQEARYQFLSSCVDLILERNSDKDLQKFYDSISAYSTSEIFHFGINAFFYLEFARLTGNEWIVQAIERLQIHFLGCSDTVFSYHRKNYAETRDSHQEIIAAIKTRDADKIRSALKKDILGKPEVKKPN